MPQPAEGRYGRLYQVRVKGCSPNIVGESHLERNDRNRFDEVHPLMADPEYAGDDPAYWRVQRDDAPIHYSGDVDRAWLRRRCDGDIVALRKAEDVGRTTLNRFVGGR